MTDNSTSSGSASGIALLIFGLSLAAAGGGVMKLLADMLPPGQIVWFRFLGYFIIMVPIVLVRVGVTSVRPARPGWQVVRGVVLATSTLAFIHGVRTLDYADAIAILYAYPFLVIVMARLFLQERPPLMAWIGVFGGFIGVLFVVKPDIDGINIGALFVLLCALFVAAQLTLNRFLGSVSDPLVTSMWGAFVAFMVLTPIAIASWQSPDADAWLLLVLLAVMGSVNQTIIVYAFTRAEASELAPFTYTEMIAGVVVGFMMFGTLPDTYAITGIVLIMLFGVLAARSYARRNVSKRAPKI